MQGLTAELIRGMWYVAAPGRDVKPGALVAKTLLGEPVLIGRTPEGAVFALKDICPHRGIPLRYGRMVGDTVECCYHGWRFDRTGTCVEIPSLREGQQVELSKIRCGAYASVEKNGLVWVFFPRAGETPAEAGHPEPPGIPEFEPAAAPRFHVMLPFACSTDHAAFGLMDPTHAAYVHTSWWFKRTPASSGPRRRRSNRPISAGAWCAIPCRRRTSSTSGCSARA